MAQPKLARFSWALYDLANTIFSMNIISLYFVLWLTVDKGCPDLYYSLALGSSIFLAALLMPILGEYSDRTKIRMPFLIGLSLPCVFFTAILGLINTIFFALLFFALANFCYQLAGMVYDSLLAQVATPSTLGRTSGMGVSLGYLGALVGLLSVKPFIMAGGRQFAFIPTAAFFLIFALPSFIFIKDRPHPYLPKIELQIKPIFSRLLKSLTQMRRDEPIVNFFISSFLCLNAVNTIIVFMGVYAKRAMKFGDAEIIYFMSLSTLFAMAGSYLFGYLTDRWGSKDTLTLVIKLWCLAIFLGGISISRWMFWLVGPLAGICLGATWVAARTMLIELSPQEKIGQMFGLFGLTARSSAILGPIVWGIITSWAFANLGEAKYRIALGLCFILMCWGYSIFKKVPDPRKIDA